MNIDANNCVISVREKEGDVFIRREGGNGRERRREGGTGRDYMCGEERLVRKCVLISCNIVNLLTGGVE